MPETAIVILNWNGIDFLKKFLGKVVSYSSGTGISVWVADNGSTDGSLDWIKENQKGVSVIDLTENHGFAGGYNLALEQINADYYVLLNSDIEVTPGWLEPMILVLENNRDTVACQPKIMSWHNREFFEHAGAAGGFIDKYGYPFCRGRILSHVEKDNGQYDNQRDIFWASGACMVVRASAWKEYGGFDSRFFAHMEEIDLCWRFQIGGLKVKFVPESVVYHVGGGSLPYNSPQKTFLNFRNSLFLLYRNLPSKKLKKILFFRMILDGVAALYFLLKGEVKHIGPIWKAHMEFYKMKPALKQELKVSSDSMKEIIYSTNMNKCIVLEFYIKRRKTFNEIKLPY